MNIIELLYRDVILDHARHPRHYGTLSNPTVTQEGINASCGDQLTLQLVVREGVIVDAAFTGSGCAVSQSTASLMTAALRGCTLDEGARLMDAFERMLRGGEPDYALGDLGALRGVAELPARAKCAELPWHTFRAALGQLEGRPG